MEVKKWKLSIVDKAKEQIAYRNNMSSTEIDGLTIVLSDFLEAGISILKKWRKLKSDADFISGEYDAGLVDFLKNSYQANGRELFYGYSSGGVNTSMKRTPESVLKSSCKQVM